MLTTLSCLLIAASVAEPAPAAPASPLTSSALPSTRIPINLGLDRPTIGETEPPATDQPAAPGQTATQSSPAEPPKAENSNNEAELAKKLSNPIADLISVPFQFNWDTGIGANNADRLTVNIQPVIPFNLTDDWNLITRTIMPVIYAEPPAAGIDSSFGLGDITQSFFFSPKDGEVLWGVGPVFLWPTATENVLGSRKWGVGPTAVVLQQQHGWTYGILANHIWSYAGESGYPSVNSTFIQPFISYTWPTATSLTLNTESTYNWSTSQWTVPINLMVAQIVKLGELPIQLQLGGRVYADGPSGGPDWGLRASVVFLLPK